MIWFLMLVIFTINNVTGQTNTAVLIKSGEPIAFECKINQPGPQCSDDCSSLMICDQSKTEPISVNSCNKISPTRPYCVNNACSILPNTTNPSCDGPFRCLTPGLYPDPNNCNRFYECLDQNKYANLYQCSSGRIFDSKLNTCVTSNNRLCPINWCPLRRSDLIAYPANFQFFMFCMDSEFGWRQKVIMKCPNEFIYDTRQQRCIFNCQKIGKFVDNLNCTRYHECQSYGLRFNWTHRACPDGFYFNKIKCEIQEQPCDSSAVLNSSSSSSPTESLPELSSSLPLPSTVEEDQSTEESPPTSSSSTPITSSPSDGEIINETTAENNESPDEEANVMNNNNNDIEMFDDHLEFVTWHYP